MRRFGLTAAAALALGCGGGARAPMAQQPAAGPAQLFVFAEGPCPKLSIEAAGERRFLVYGDHGRVLAGWMPGDRVAAAETLAELDGGRVFRRPSLTSGLPLDARGYVPGELRVGGADGALWLVRTTLRYSLVERGPLFERTPAGYRFEAGWQPTNEPVTLPERARRLPALSGHEVCGEELDFVPLTWATTPTGGLVVAGRCDDDAAANYSVTTLMVARGEPNATKWAIDVVPFGERLGGIVNLSLAAPADDELYLAAYEPFEDLAKRSPFLARFDGRTWTNVELGLRDGIMSVAADGRGSVWLAAGRTFYRLEHGKETKLALPPLRFVEQPGAIQIRVVRYLDGELWVEGAYLVHRRDERGSHWASVLYSSRKPDVPLYCDARELADGALVEALP